MQILIDIFLRLDTHLANVIAQYGVWTYALLFVVLFCETGLVITPFLPGDSLLFAAGTFAASGALDLLTLLVLLIFAAILGDTVNYWIGRRIGTSIITHGKFFRIKINPKHLERTHRFYDKYGAKTIVLARFMPIVRTFAPFVAGVGQMHYKTFFVYNVVGGALWVALFTLGGYFFGNLPAVQHNFTFIILAIIVISFIPPIFEFLRQLKEKKSRYIDKK